MAQVPPGAWAAYCAQAEVPGEIQADLHSAIGAGTAVVLLLDDSGSMSTPVRLPGSSPFAPVTTTRWTELQNDVASIIQLVTSVNPKGIDVHFMNRAGASGVSDVSQVGPLFAAPPSGGTPVVGCLQRLFAHYATFPGRVLFMLVTDGEPSDGDYSMMFRTLQSMPRNVYMSLIECNDNEEEMNFLTGWDTQLRRFHNQEDYPEELNLVRRIQGPSTRFTRANYIQMCCLSPIFPKYAIDMRVAGGKRNPFSGAATGAPIMWGTVSPSAPAAPPSMPYATQNPAYGAYGSGPPGAYAPPPMGGYMPPPPPGSYAPPSAGYGTSGGGASYAPTAPVAAATSVGLSAFQGNDAWAAYCVRAEVPAHIQADLWSALSSNTKVVMLLDDSGSMGTRVNPPGSPPGVITTRWMELLNDTADLLTLVNAVSPTGVDVHFLNRPGVMDVTSPAQIAPFFASGPSGGTPMIGALRRLFSQYARMPSRVLLLFITDGEPSDGTYNQLFTTLQGIPQNMYISFVECNDNEEEMNYLSSWDTRLPRFHNQEDYGAELNLVRRAQGQNVKFTRANYIQMCVLSPIYPKYAIDIRRMGQGCCSVM